MDQHLRPHDQQQPRSYQVVKTATTITVLGSLMVLFGLTLAGTVMVATPLLILFCPILVPAAITVCLLGSGFAASRWFGGVAVKIYKYVDRKHPSWANNLDQPRMKLASKAREMKDRAEQFGSSHRVTGTVAS